jgi:anthranilate phosphoribosyltransferase
MGVFDASLSGKLAQVLQQLGSRHVLVVCAEEGLDEISLASPTTVAELQDGRVTEYELEPGLFGLPQVAASELVVNGKDEAVAMLRSALENRHAGAAAITALNAGAAIYVAGCAASLMQGVAAAQEAITSGAARSKLDDYLRFSQT